MAANNLIVFATSPARAGLAKDPTMAEHLTRDQVTTDVLLEKLTLAGFEAKMEDEDLYIVPHNWWR